jgi:hypothetical protein
MLPLHWISLALLYVFKNRFIKFIPRLTLVLRSGFADMSLCRNFDHPDALTLPT